MIAFEGGKVSGKVSPPPSKSHTHRAIIMSALSGGPCKVSNPLLSFDTRSTMDAVRALGAEVTEHDGYVDLNCPKLHAPDREIDVGNSGTTLRLMTGIASLFPSETVLTGDESIRRRPMGPLLEALENCGVSCSSNDGKPPVRIRGPVSGKAIDILGSMSSQFVSSAIMMSPLTENGMTVNIIGEMVSKPYVDITTHMMGRFGITVQETEGGYRIEHQSYAPIDYRVPADFSSAAFPLVAGALGGTVTVDGMDLADPQGDRRIIEVLRAAGAEVTSHEDKVTCSAGELRGVDVDMSDIPDLFPVVAVLLSTANGTSRLFGAPHLRFKESDRITLTENMLRTLGADITATDDGCIINGVERLHGGRVEHDGDHRMFMAAAVASIVADGPVEMEDDGCWNVSYPGFPEQLASLGVSMRTL